MHSPTPPPESIKLFQEDHLTEPFDLKSLFDPESDPPSITTLIPPSSPTTYTNFHEEEMRGNSISRLPNYPISRPRNTRMNFPEREPRRPLSSVSTIHPRTTTFRGISPDIRTSTMRYPDESTSLTRTTTEGFEEVARFPYVAPTPPYLVPPSDSAFLFEDEIDKILETITDSAREIARIRTDIGYYDM